jgi:hypothetical protein
MLCAVLLCAVFGGRAAAAVSVEDVERRIRKKLQKKWVCKDLVVEVVPYESQSETDKGHFKSILLKADVAKWKGLAIRPIYLKSQDVVLDIPKLVKDEDIVTKSCKKTTFKARMGETDLNGLFQKKKMPIKNPKIDLGKGDVTFTGTYQVARLGSNLKLVGEFDVKNETDLWFSVKKAWISGVPLPSSVLNQVLKLVNPLINFSELPFSPRIKKFQIEDKAVTVIG